MAPVIFRQFEDRIRDLRITEVNPSLVWQELDLHMKHTGQLGIDRFAPEVDLMVRALAQAIVDVFGM